jgi:hypothetical protein
MYNYGKEYKKVVFYALDKDHAELRIRIHYDGMTQGDFFRGLLMGYLNRDESIIAYIDRYKEEFSLQSKNRRNKIKKTDKARLDTIEKFALNDEEIENIFDILEADL